MLNELALSWLQLLLLLRCCSVSKTGVAAALGVQDLVCARQRYAEISREVGSLVRAPAVRHQGRCVEMSGLVVAWKERWGSQQLWGARRGGESEGRCQLGWLPEVTGESAHTRA